MIELLRYLEFHGFTSSGKETTRPQLEELLRFLRDGDTLVVHSMTGSPGTWTTCGPWCRSSRRYSLSRTADVGAHPVGPGVTT
jgi:hypothetical protein